MRAFYVFTFAVVVGCAEPSTAPATAPTATASLEVPPLPNDRAGAEQAFQDARQAMQAGDMTKARALFLRSHRLDPAVGTLLNLAMWEEKLGLRDEAPRHYQAAYDGSMKEGRSERAAIAKSRLDALRGRP